MVKESRKVGVCGLDVFRQRTARVGILSTRFGSGAQGDKCLRSRFQR